MNAQFIVVPPVRRRLLGGKQRREESGRKKWRKVAGVAGNRALGVKLKLSRGAGALDRILPYRGRHGSTDSFIGLAPVLAGFWGRGCGCVFGPEPKNCAGTILGAPVEMLSEHL
jgi:hypothetical protein